MKELHLAEIDRRVREMELLGVLLMVIFSTPIENFDEGVK